MSESKVIKKGTVIFHEGEASDCLYYIDGYKDAKVVIYGKYGTDEEVNLNVLTEGKFMGEMGVLNNTVRSATAVALTDISVKVISKEEFHTYFTEHPIMMLQLLKSTADTLVGLTRKYSDACMTVNDYMEAKESGQKISPELAARLEKYTE